MKSPPFGYARSTTLADTFRLLAEGGPTAVVLAGGQSLLAGLAFRLSEPSVLVDITGVPEFQGVAAPAGGGLVVGALTTHAELARSPLVRDRGPLLADAAALIAHAAIRNRGTIGGSLAYADPAAELPACCVALGARIVAVSPRGERHIAADAFFTGLFSTALRNDELIRAVEFPPRGPGQRSVVLELTRRAGDYAMAGIVLVADVDGPTLRAPRVVFFGVGPVPVVATRAAAALAAGGGGDAAVETAQATLDHDLDPPDDMHGGADFKRQLARTLLARAVAQMLDEGRAA